MEGLHPNMLTKEIAIGEETVLVREYLMRKNKDIQSMEHTNYTGKKGRWLFVAMKGKTKEVSEFLDKELQKLHKKVISSKL
eukprot:8684661-Ditylum_brightwellii.AAC.1